MKDIIIKRISSIFEYWIAIVFISFILLIILSYSKIVNGANGYIYIYILFPITILLFLILTLNFIIKKKYQLLKTLCFKFFIWILILIISISFIRLVLL